MRSFGDVGGDGLAALSYEVQADVVFEDFGHQTIDASTDGGKLHEDIRALVFRRS